MHLQKTDSFAGAYSVYNNLRFDYHRFTSWGGYRSTPPTSALFGSGNSNPVPPPALGLLRWYNAQDVNSHDVDYDFTNRRVFDDRNYGSVPYNGADFYPNDGWVEPGGIPLVPLTDDNAKWRGIMVEDDDRVGRFSTGYNQWSDDVQTFSFVTGQYANTNTKIRSTGSCGGLFCNDDDVFTQNAFRSANLFNVDRLSDGGSIPIDARRNGWKFVFELKNVLPNG